MNRVDHHVAGFLAGLTVAPTVPGPVWQHAATVAVATVTAGGVLSPDVDQLAWWRRMDRWVPDEWLGHGGPLGHRGITHSPYIPAVVAGYALWSHGPLAWLLLAVAVGWGLGHDLPDMAFGQAGYGVGEGIPWILWWGHWGVGGKSGGVLERWVARPVMTVGAVVAGLHWWPTGWAAAITAAHLPAAPWGH